MNKTFLDDETNGIKIETIRRFSKRFCNVQINSEGRLNTVYMLEMYDQYKEYVRRENDER